MNGNKAFLENKIKQNHCPKKDTTRKDTLV